MVKRVCIFSAQYLPSSYGVEKYTFNLAYKLSKRGIEVTIVTSDLYGAKTYEKNGNITIYRVPSYGMMKNRLPIIRYNREFRNMIKRISEEEYDLCITNTRFYPLSLVGTLIGKKHAKRNILIEHGTSHIEMSNMILKYCGEIYEHAITFFEKQNVKEFYGVSKDCEKWLEHFGIKAKGVINNAINKEEINKIKHEEIRDKWGIPSNKILISFTGRLIKEKGVLQLVRAFRRLEKKYSHVCLVIAGDGPLMPELNEDCGDNVFILGRVSFENVINLLRESEIFCFPSEYAEGMPTSILEAAICGNCIISTKCGGAMEIIPDDTHGIIIRDNSEEAIEEALEKVVANNMYRKNMSKKVKEYVENLFVWDRIVDKVCNLFL